MVIGDGGERLKRIGSEARQELEKLMGCKVFLEIWVKVRTGWADELRQRSDRGRVAILRVVENDERQADDRTRAVALAIGILPAFAAWAVVLWLPSAAWQIGAAAGLSAAVWASDLWLSHHGMLPPWFVDLRTAISVAGTAPPARSAPSRCPSSRAVWGLPASRI